MLINKKNGLAFSLLISLMVIILYFIIQIFLITPQQDNLDEIQFGKTIKNIDLLSKQINVQNLYQKEISYFSTYFFDYYSSYLILYSVNLNCWEDGRLYLFDDYNEIENNCLPYLPLDESEYFKDFNKQLLNQFDKLSDKISDDIVKLEVESKDSNNHLDIILNSNYNLNENNFQTSISKTNIIEFEVQDFFNYFFDISKKLDQLNSTISPFICNKQFDDYHACIEKNFIDHFLIDSLEEVNVLGIYDLDSKLEIDLLLIPKNKQFPNFEFSIRKLKTTDMDFDST